jgi:hypothetical protein
MRVLINSLGSSKEYYRSYCVAEGLHPRRIGEKMAEGKKRAILELTSRIGFETKPNRVKGEFQTAGFDKTSCQVENTTSTLSGQDYSACTRTYRLFVRVPQQIRS